MVTMETDFDFYVFKVAQSLVFPSDHSCFTRTGSCQRTPKGHFEAAFSINRLDYVNLSGVFHLLAVGVGLSIMVLIGEYIYWMFQKMMERRSINGPSMVRGTEEIDKRACCAQLEKYVL